MFRMLKKKWVLASLGLAASLVLVAGAFGYFTSTGSGTGSATVGSATNYQVAVAAATGGPLYPGAGSTSTNYSIKNVGGGNQNLTAVTAALTTDSAGGVYDTTSSQYVDGCLASWFTVTNTPPTLPDDLASGGSVTGSATVTLTDAPTSQNACEGLTPQLTVSAS